MTAPTLLALAAAAVWGLWWIPIRYLESLGLSGAEGGLVMNGGALLVSLVLCVVLRQGFGLSLRAVLGAALIGVAISTYSVALTYSDVVRVVLLFYLAPAWSKIIEWGFLHMPWRWTSSVALIAALVGAFLVMGADFGSDAWRLGDGLAVLSGMAWAAGAALVFTANPARPLALTVATSLCAVLISFGFALLQGLSWPIPVSAAGLGAGVGAVFVLPILVATLWSAQKLAPATLSFLLTAEILSGILSGALLAGEPFGRLQMAGAVLVVLGAMVEIVPSMMRPAARS
ncbi:MAG: EamA family transporter [Sedimentitalea sp.]